MSGSQHTTVHIVAQTLRPALGSFIHQFMVHMNGGITIGHKQGNVTDTRVGAIGYDDALLNTEEAWHQTFGSKALWV